MKQSKWRVSANAALPVIAMGLIGPTAGFAQAAPDENDLTEVVVTGTASRVNREGYEAPTPTTILGPETLAAQAKLNVAEYINNIPSMTPTYQPGGATSIGSNRPNFRGLGPVRTLVLMDGNRVGYTDPLGGVDLNIIPTSLVERIEVVSGGASAGWGSDAIAGVMNFHLNSTFEGIKGNAQCGESQYGDNQQCGAGLGAGTSFFNGKLHAVAAVDYLTNNGVRYAPDSRDWASKNTGLVQNDAYTATNGQYKFLFTRNACWATLSNSGVITNTALKGTTFNSQGQPEPFIYGPNTGPTNQFLMEGGTCSGFYGRYISSQTAPLQRQNGYTRLTYDLTDSTSVYAEALFAHTKSSILSTPMVDNAGVTISIDNAYLPASIRARMVTAGVTSFNFGRFLPEMAPDNISANTSLQEGENTVSRYVVGGKGAIVGSWTWDAHAQYSRAAYEFRLNGNRNNAKWLRSLNSEIDPATGLPRCKTNPGQTADPTCVPVNVFGAGAVSQNAISYFGGTPTGLAYYRQTGAAVNIQGEPFSMPAGPVSLAGGVETRNERLAVEVDAVQAAGGWRFNALNNESGVYTVNEAYLETVVPILKDLPLVSNLDFNAAGRITDYSNSGNVETWKLGLNYTPFESGVLRFRGTLSVDIRAPTLHELYSQRVVGGTGVIFDPFRGGISVSTGPQTTGGNPDLVPEEARTKVLGFVFAPNYWGLDGLTLSADYYDIQITNGITNLNAQQTVDTCFLGVASVCAGITRDSNNVITSMFSQIYNAQGLRNEGIDLSLTYARALSDWFGDVPGKLTLNGLATFVNQQTIQTGTSVLNNVGVRSDAMSLIGVPKWSGSVSAQYDLDAWMFYLQMRFLSGVMNIYTTDPLQYENNHIASYRVLNTTVQYQLKDGLQVYGGVDNLLNKAVPLNAGIGTSAASGVGSSGYYDRVGRSYKLGVRFNF